MAKFIPDTIDFSAYEREAECRVKVRKASAYADDLEAEFAPRSGPRDPCMRSTRLREAIEFRPGEVTTWAGFNGHRKSMFTGQVALDLCQQDQRTLIVSLEMAPRWTLSRMARQATAVTAPNAYQRAAFLRWTDGRLWLFDHEGRLLPERCIAVCRYFAQELQGKHVFIDSFMKVVQSEESLDEQKRMVGDLCDVAKETGLHIHVVAHCRKPNGGSEDHPPTKYDIRGSASISDQCPNVITIWANKPKKGKASSEQQPVEHGIPDAVITVEKQRNGAIEGRYGMWFDEQSLRFVDSPNAVVDAYEFRGLA